MPGLTEGDPMATLQERMIGAAMLNPATYEEVEADQTATGQAALVVVIAAVSGGLASLRYGPMLVMWTIVAALIGWAVWAFLTYYIGTKFMPEPQTSADMGQLLRVVGFAMAPGVLGILGIIPFLGVLIRFVLSLWQLAAMVIGVRQALDYSNTGRAVVVCLIGFVVQWIVMTIIFTMTVGSAFLMSGAMAR
jgi:hypothetical protein